NEGNTDPYSLSSALYFRRGSVCYRVSGCVRGKMAASASVSSEEVKVERFISPGRGNGLRARTEIKPGQLIYSSQPIAFCVAQKFLKSTCQTCLCRGESLLRCSQCKSSRFCSVQCQLNDPAADSQELYSITQHQSHLGEMSEEREGLVQLCSMLKLYLDSDVPQLPSGLDPMSLIARVSLLFFFFFFFFFFFSFLSFI
ncbi:hypothetical protein PHYPO_G00020640, partial [Pangasianodon hypophthalmus]